jgi:hypothetical protein
MQDGTSMTAQELRQRRDELQGTVRGILKNYCSADPAEKAELDLEIHEVDEELAAVLELLRLPAVLESRASH